MGKTQQNACPTHQSYVGECGYYSKSDEELGKKKVPWHWDEEHIKKLLMT
jgi:hypothetical protein